MNQAERRIFLIQKLLEEQPAYEGVRIPAGEWEQKKLLRALFNVRRPGRIDDEFLVVQDEYLREETARKGVTDLSELRPVQPGIYLWQGDITTLRCGAIVNAANSGMTGCYQPGHHCIDNCIHTFAGVQLRNLCGEIMEAQGCAEPTGRAKITPAFNLPCGYVIHTVGPIVQGRLTREHRKLLASSYRACLDIGDENRVGSIAFCCISTGVFGFPKEEAAKIAVKAVQDHRRETGGKTAVIFNVHRESDYEIYRGLLG